MQNQLLKVLTGKEYRYSTDKLHSELELLKFSDIKEQEILTFVHNFFSNSLPPVFSGYFETLASNHNINTRYGGNLTRILGHNTNIVAKSIKIQGAKLWNKTDKYLINTPKAKLFKTKFKNKFKNSTCIYICLSS